MIKKLSLMALSAFVVLFIAAPVSFANEEHACKTDADCEHGQHCKEGHCHE